MNTHADKTQENKSQSIANEPSQKQSGGKSTFQFVDNRPEAVAQRKLQEMANNSPRVAQLRAFQGMANNSPQANQAAQLQSMADNHSTQQQQPIQKKENNTGLPDTLKTGMENLSGMSLDDVKVHRNSDKPAQLQAHAYAQGTDVHLGPGQEKHLPHEAWHVVQQKQGRVKPTMQMKGKVNVNDDAGLEKEADVMGQKAMQMNSTARKNDRASSVSKSSLNALQLKVQDDQGTTLSIQTLKEALGPEYAAKLTIKLNERTTHVHETKNMRKALKKGGGDALNKLGENESEVFSEIGRAIDESNPMYFTVQNIKDYLDGKKIPGISIQDESGIKAATAEPEDGTIGTEAEKALAKVTTLKATIEKLKENRAEQENKESNTVESDGEKKYEDDGTQTIADHFKNSVFYYGTTSESSLNPPIWDNLIKKIKKAKADRMGEDAGVYNAGTRNLGFLKGKKASEEKKDGKSHQMMDMYYGGQEFEAWQMMRNPVIGQYIHDMMGYAGKYDQSESPDTTFRKNFPLGGKTVNDKGKETWQNRGWSKNSKPKENENMKGVPKEWQDDKSGTMEISRLIRDAVAKFGGTIVFEASGVYSQGNFVSGAYQGDTNVEAESMLPFFAENSGKSRVAVGKGEYVFQWRGKETIPTRELFSSYWAKGGLLGREVDEKGNLKEGGGWIEYTGSTAKWGEDKKGTGELKLDKPESWFWKFPAR